MKKSFLQEGLTPNFLLVKIKRYGISRDGFTVQTQDSSFHPYSLCGVLTHIGNQINSGHYITEVKINDIWWKCNDDQITQTSFDSLSRQAYAFLFKKM